MNAEFFKHSIFGILFQLPATSFQIQVYSLQILFIFLISLKSYTIKRKRDTSTAPGIKKFKGAMKVVIEKSYNPWNKIAYRMPSRLNDTPFLLRKEESAKKYPKRAEQRVCRKVAPINRIRLISTVVPKIE